MNRYSEREIKYKELICQMELKLANAMHFLKLEHETDDRWLGSEFNADVEKLIKEYYEQTNP